jgi:cbb3-type cytochrome oxidase subunit 3
MNNNDRKQLVYSVGIIAMLCISAAVMFFLFGRGSRTRQDNPPRNLAEAVAGARPSSQPTAATQPTSDAAPTE